MKTQRVVIVALSILVVVLAYLAFSHRNKPEESSPVTTAGMGHTNTLELWRTNMLDRWLTNTVTLTNTVLQPVTNEVVKEVPAKLSDPERQAATAGYRYLHAPTLENAPDALYKLGAIAVDVYTDPTTASLLGQSVDQIKKNLEAELASQNIPTAEKSSQVLRVGINPQWRMSDPRVALIRCKVDLKEPALVQRQNDLVKFETAVWSTSTANFVRTINLTEGVDKCLQECINKFSHDYRDAKEREKQLESRVAKVPADFLSGAQAGNQ
ncbi:MAG TPA: hypothetical protein VL361_14020 [Candidatus Limnocylindrales bacterium]|nr:hypothetical protein [Candidatus Limnocylindrales bacterium]